MLSFLPAPVRGGLALLLILMNTVVFIVPLLVATFLRLLLPLKFWQRGMAALLVVIAESWIWVNNAILALTQRLQLDIKGVAGLHYHGWYLVKPKPVKHYSFLITILNFRIIIKRR